MKSNKHVKLLVGFLLLLAFFSCSRKVKDTYRFKKKKINIYPIETKKFDGLTSLAVHPGGYLIAAGYRDEIYLWDIPTGEINKFIEIDDLKSLVFSPDGQYIAFGSSTPESIKIDHLEIG